MWSGALHGGSLRQAAAAAKSLPRSRSIRHKRAASLLALRCSGPSWLRRTACSAAAQPAHKHAPHIDCHHLMRYTITVKFGRWQDAPGSDVKGPQQRARQACVPACWGARWAAPAAGRKAAPRAPHILCSDQLRTATPDRHLRRPRSWRRLYWRAARTAAMALHRAGCRLDPGPYDWVSGAACQPPSRPRRHRRRRRRCVWPPTPWDPLPCPAGGGPGRGRGGSCQADARARQRPAGGG